MVAFMGYCLWVCLKHKLKASASGLQSEGLKSRAELTVEPLN